MPVNPIRITVMNWLNIMIQTETQTLILGTTVNIEIEVRDPDGNLYTPPSQELEVTIYLSDPNGDEVGSSLVTVSGPQVILEGIPQPGLFRAPVDTSASVFAAAGMYAVQVSVPYQAGYVVASETFNLVPKSPVPTGF